MSRATNLDNIIRTVPLGSEGSVGKDEVVLYYDPKKRVASEKPTLVARLRVQQPYAIVPDKAIKYVAPPLIIDSDVGETLKVSVSCHVVIPRDQARRVVAALAQGESAIEVLDQLLKKALDAYKHDSVIRMGIDAVEKFFEVRRSWQESVAETLENQTGLRVTVNLGSKEKLEDASYTADIPVFVHDYENQINLGLRVELVLDEDSRRNAVVSMNRDDDLYQAIRDKVRAWVPEELGISDLVKDIGGHPQLRTIINEASRPFGRKASFIKCKPNLPFDIPDVTGIIRHAHACKPKGIDPKKPIRISHSIGVQISDLALFLTSKIDDVAQSLTQMAEGVAERVASQSQMISFTDTNFDTEIRDPIHGELRTYAESVGLKLLTYEVEPDFGDRGGFSAEEQIQEDITVRTEDCNEDLTISIDITVVVPENLRAEAIASEAKREPLKTDVIKGIRTLVRENFRIGQFIGERNRQEIRETVEKAIKVAARLYGRQVVKSEITPKVPFRLPAPENTTNTRDYSIRDSDTKLQVKQTFLLGRTDVGKCLRSKKTDPSKWPDAELERITRHVLIERSYTEIVSTFSDLKAVIKENFERSVAQHGYAVRTYSAELVLDGDLFAAKDVNDKFSVHAKDCDEALVVHIEGRFNVTDQTQTQLTAPNPARLAEAIRTDIANFVRETGVHDFCLKAADVARSLETVAAKSVEAFGCSVDYCNIELEFPFDLPELDVIEYTHECKIQDLDEPINVKHDILLRLEDVAKYRRSGIVDVSEWIQQQLQQVTQEQLFKCSYVTIVLDFDKVYHPKIESAMQRIAGESGFSLTQFSSVPDIPAIRLHQVPHDCDIPERGFTTKDNREPVKLKLDARLRIEDLSKVANYLTPDTQLLDEFSESIVSSTQRVLHEVSPERFYLHFENEYVDVPPLDSDSAMPPRKTLSVLGEIENEIRSELLEKFGVVCTRVSIRQTDTQLTLRLTNLCQQRPVVDIVARPVDGGPQVHFKLSFRILAVVPENWSAFLSSAHRNKDGEPDVAAEIADITDFVRKLVSAKLDHTLPMQVLLFESNQLRERLQTVVWEGIGDSQGVNPAVAERYGLTTVIDAFEREDAPHERLQRKATEAALEAEIDRESKRIQHIEKTIDELEAEERRLLLDDAEHEELGPLRNEIESQRRKIESSPAMKNSVKPVAPKRLSDNQPDALEHFLTDGSTTPQPPQDDPSGEDATESDSAESK